MATVLRASRPQTGGDHLVVPNHVVQHGNRALASMADSGYVQLASGVGHVATDIGRTLIRLLGEMPERWSVDMPEVCSRCDLETDPRLVAWSTYDYAVDAGPYLECIACAYGRHVTRTWEPSGS
jgi:hypothetical protein